MGNVLTNIILYLFIFSIIIGIPLVLLIDSIKNIVRIVKTIKKKEKIKISLVVETVFELGIAVVWIFGCVFMYSISNLSINSF